MPDAILGILFLAALIAVFVLWKKFTSAVGNKATQTILRPKDHRAGRDLVSKLGVFTVKASSAEASRAILAQVAAQPSAPVVKPGLYLVQSSDTLIVFDYGTKLQTVFRALVQIQATEGGAKGTFRFTNWMEGSGIVVRQREMNAFNSSIEAALTRIDPQASIRVAS